MTKTTHQESGCTPPFSDIEIKMVLEGLIDHCEHVLADANRRSDQLVEELEWLMSPSEAKGSFNYTCMAVDKDPGTERTRILAIYTRTIQRRQRTRIKSARLKVTSEYNRILQQVKRGN